MSRSGGMSQLLKGIIIGVVLIMAIIGTMSMLDKGNPLSTTTTNNQQQTSNNSSQDIVAPSITLNPDDVNNTGVNSDSSNIGDLNAVIPEDKTTEEINNTVTQTIENTVDNNTVKPVLEDERTVEEAAATQIEEATFGMMEINAVNPNNSQSVKASYAVFNQKNIKVAESKNANNASYRLPVGQYKVETTLNRVDEVTNQVIPVVTKSRYIIVRKNATVKQTFELEPPSTTGVLQVSAKMNDKAVRANFVIQKANGEVVASRNNVTNSLFKLNSGTYKVSVNSGNNKDFRSIEVKAGESLQTVFILKQAAQQGKLLVRVFDTRSSNPVRADIIISNANGAVVQELKSSTQTELSLAAGDYKIKVIGPNGTSNKNIRVNPGQALNEVFRFDAPSTNVASQNDTQSNVNNSQQVSNQNTQQNTPQTNSTQITDNVTIKPVEPETTPPVQPENTKATLRVIALDQQTKRPIKSNIYIQTPTGKHLDKKTYVDSASFSLAPGTYKVTVRANNRNNLVKNIRITANNNISETFNLTKPNQPLTQSQPQPKAVEVVNAPAPPPIKANPAPKAIPTGFLSVSMQAPRGTKVNPNTLNTHFIVATTAGKKIVELTSVKEGNFKLDVGSYVVTAIHKNKRRSQRVDVRQNQNARIAFNTTDFLAAKGVLRSRIIDGTGRPLKGNLTVSNMAGKVIARANGVTTAVFDLPPVRHTISVNYQGLSGSEVVNINPNETTVQTFTVASGQQQPTNERRNLQDILKDKIKKEIQRNL